MSSQQNDIRAPLITIKDMISASVETKWGLSPQTQLNIPIYQRLYVWSNEQIERLLTDINQTRQQAQPHNEQDTAFYLGGITLVDTSNPERGTHSADLIDGQQRFTTLWLLCCYLYEKLTDNIANESGQTLREELLQFIRIAANDKTECGYYLPRLNFTARDLQNKALTNIAPHIGKGHSGSWIPNEEREGPRGRLIQPLYEARELFEAFFREEAVPYHDFARYLLEKVRLVATVVPAAMDLNKLFEVINGRGVQLQHHEILKARLLNCIPQDKQPHYAKLWDACADMRGFADQNLTRATRLQANQLAKLFDGENPSGSDLAKGEGLIDKLEAQRDGALPFEQDAAKLEAILNTQAEIEAKIADDSKSTDKNESGDDEYRIWAEAPLTFSMLLQHTLRIWLHEHRNVEDIQKIDDKWLVQCFEIHGFEGKVKPPQGHASSFICLLWQLRFILDYYVIKWVDLGEEKVLQVVKSEHDGNDSKAVIRRTRGTDALTGLSLLQAMLYHSQASATQYWLTPFLHFVYQQKCTLEDAYAYLRHLDNILFGRPTQLPPSLKPLVKRTKYLLTHPLSDLEEVIEGAIQRPLDFEHELTQEAEQEGYKMGTEFRQYWFYKLDFVLWYLEDKKKRDSSLIFRMTARNSIEHVCPQTPRPGEKAENRVSRDRLNCFGNLALVSRPLNSEFSNLSFEEKKAKFKATGSRTNHSPSLKMDDIYGQTKWDDDAMIAHQKRMIQAMKEYYEETTLRPSKGAPYPL